MNTPGYEVREFTFTREELHVARHRGYLRGMRHGAIMGGIAGCTPWLVLLAIWAASIYQV